MTISALLLAVAAQIAAATPAQAPAGPAPEIQQPPAGGGEQLRIWLLTMGPGDQVWERFGHNAIRVHHAPSGADISYHWGLFDFTQSDFVPRFIRGRMLYSMGAFGTAETIESYRRANRTVWMQELSLTPEQKAALATFLEWNMLPENREYSYDYFRDNCSTRVRDALDAVLGGAIAGATRDSLTGTSYRFHTARLTQDDWPLFTGTMMGMGQPTDREITLWEEMFLPVRMMETLRNVRIDTPEGAVPLVAREEVLFQAARDPEPATVSRGVPGYLAMAALILVVGAAMAALGHRRATGGLSLALAWSIVAGAGGLILAFLWGFTDHIHTYRNENLLQLNPLSLLLAILLGAWLWRTRKAAVRPPLGGGILTLAIVIAGLSAAGLLVKLFPSMIQGNAIVIAFALPLHLGVAALIALVRSRQTRAH